MAATTQQIRRLRRMVNELDTTTYTDNDLSDYIEKYPLLDELGREAYTVVTGTQPPTYDRNEDWIPTYDLNAAAADVWEEKAAAVANYFDFSADGGRYSASQKHQQYMEQVEHFRSQRAITTITLHKWPPESPDRSWLTNRRED
jgi:hypothetical protein